MRLVHSLSVLLVAFSAAASPSVTPSAPVPPPAVPSQALLDLPVTFERNAGQFSAEVDFVSRAQGQALSINAAGATVLIGDASGPKQEIRLRFEGARRNAPALDTPVTSYANYISGNDPSRWLTGVTAHESVRYGGVYDGIDIEYHARRGALEYDLIVAPGADWRDIAITVDGAAPVLEPNGDLLLCSGANQVRHVAPYAYQTIGGKEIAVESRYELRDDRIAFVVGDYDRSQPLVIDPILDFARGVFPLHRLSSTDLTRDTGGNLYLVATVWSPTATTLGGTTKGYLSDDILVAKLSSNASQILFSTYLGGSGDERTARVALGAGDVFVTGVTLSGDFPTTAGAFGERVKMPVSGSTTRSFVSRLDGTTGAVEYSTYIERFLSSTIGTEANDIVVDAAGQAIVGGQAAGLFPLTPGAYIPTNAEGSGAGFLTKFSADGQSLVFSTRLPGETQGVAVDADGFVYAGGNLGFTNTMVGTDGAYQKDEAPGFFNYLLKMTPEGTPVYVTYAPGQNLVDIALDSSRNVVAVVTPSDFYPTSANAYRPTPLASTDIGIFKLSASGGTLISSTFFGGSSADTPRQIAVGPLDTIYLTMLTASGDIPMVNAVQPDRFFHLNETVLAKFDANLTSLLFSTYFGPSFGPKSALDAGGNIYLMVVNGGEEEDGIWLKGSQPPYGHYSTTQIARLLLGAGSAGFAIDYVERGTAAANVIVEGKYHVRGTGFQQGANVFFGDAQAPILSVFAGGTAIKFKTPQHALGTVDVTVKNPDTSTAVGPQPFVYQEGHNSIENVTGTMDTLGNGTVTITATRLPPQPIVRADLRTDSLSSEQDLAKQIVSSDATTITFKLGPMPNITKRVFFEVPHPHDIAANVFTTLSSTHLLVTPAPVPTLRELRPSVGKTTGGESITVIGSNFHKDARVIIGRVFARGVTFVNDSTLLATVPPNSGGLADVTVVNPDFSAATMGQSFTYRGITSISPGSGPISGNTLVTIDGQGFTAPVSVSIGGVAATNVTLTGTTQIKARTGARASGIVDVSVTSGPDTFTLPASFRYLDPPPVVSAVSPASGPDTGGTSVAVSGTGFLPGAKVFFDGVAATSVTFVGGTRVDAVTPPMPAGPASVQVENFDEQSGTGFNVYTYTGIERLTPVLGSPGTVVTAFGGGFVAGATVTLGGAPATNVQFVSGNQLKFTVPAATPGIVDVVINSGPLTLTKDDGFRILAPPPTITGFTPNTGLPGSEVVLTGTNFVDVISVTFKTNANANFTVDSPTQITAIVPNAGQTGTLTVKTDSGTATSVSSYTVENAAAEIATISPTAGSPGTLVTITGIKMGGATSVRFNGTEAATFTLTGTTEIKAVVPEGGSTGPICITTPGPFTGCSAASFRYPPTVTGFSPPNALPGDAVTITGVDFVNVDSVAFNDVNATFVVNPGGTSIDATVPATAITGPITVTTDAGAGTSSTSFGVRPVITGFTPARSGIGTTVTITGLRFNGATGVTIGGSSATFTVISDTQIAAKVPATAVDGPIVVVTPGGSATSSTSFTVALTPIASSFSPVKGTPGTTVAITGRNFNTTTAVRFNGTPASFTIVGDDLINAIVPAAATTGPIALVNVEGSGLTETSFYLPPVLSNFAPNAGAIGSNVTINGNNFTDAVSVTFNNVEATFTVNAPDKITAVVPATATDGKITVTTPYGPVTGAFNFVVTSSNTPTVTATAVTATQVLVTWTSVPGHSYQVRRIEHATDRFVDGAIANVAGSSFVDNTVVAGKTYLYNIADMTTSLIGNADSATTILFTDDPVSTGMAVKKVHLTQLRSAVNAMRIAASLPARTWTDANPLLIRAVHVNELRTALAEAYLQLSRYVTFSDSPLPAAMVVRAAHFSELRNATK